MDRSEGVLSKLFHSYPSIDQRLLAAAVSSYKAPSYAIFALSTEFLSKVLRVCKAYAKPDCKGDVEHSFMELVSNVSRDIILLVYYALIFRFFENLV